MIQPVKGTHDLFEEEANAFTYVINVMNSISELFAYKEIRVPVIEHSELFIRSVGESSDVVRKEMYTFEDKGGRSLTLRPEFTAGILRSIVSNKLYATSELPIKLHYCGPIFRYDRPQLGRYRQFYQFGVESVGVNNILNDVECIVLAYSILNSLGLENVVLKINTLGDEESRNSYKEALKEFFKDKIENMCEDCKKRYEINPLRILDCKVPEDQELAKQAPKICDYLSENSKKRFDEVIETLKDFNIPCEVDDSLVRGLDYYSETVFEFHYTSKKNVNYGAIGGGGHYHKLLKELGGPDLPGFGFSFGIERIVSVLKDDDLLDKEEIANKCQIYVMPMGQKERKFGLDMATSLRMWGFKVDICFEDVKFGNMFKRAEKKGADYAVIIGENELNNEKVVVKNMKTQEQEEVANSELLQYFVHAFESEDDCCCGHHHDDDEECCCGHHHDKECCCGDNCCNCGHKPGEFPCQNGEECPCGKDPNECECVINGFCSCKEVK